MAGFIRVFDMAVSKNLVKIRLVSTAGTGHFYTTTKNKATHPEKLELRKYDPVVRKHVLYKEQKMK